MLAKELEGIAKRSGDPDLAKLCGLVRANYAYPVDSVLIAADLDVVGHVNVQEPRAQGPRGYLAFLREGLAKARGEPIPEEQAEPAHDHGRGASIPAPVTLTPEAPSGSVLDLVRRGAGPGIRFYSIDVSAFDGAIELELEVRVGGGDLAGRFELCAAPADDPSLFAPVAALAKVAPGSTERVAHAFEEGAHVGLAVMPAHGATEGELSAFLATLRVRAR